MRGDLFRFAVGAFWIWSYGLMAQSNDSAVRLRQNRAALLALLQKVEKGSDPCFSDSCQTKKRNLVEQIYLVAEEIPGVDSIFLKNRQTGIQSAFDLIRHRFAPDPSGQFPHTAKEWAYYWKKRSDQSDQIKSKWMSFLSEIYTLNDGLQVYVKVLRTSEENQALIQEAYEKGAADAAELIIKAALYVDRASQLQAQGKSREANDLRQEALNISKEREKIEERFRGEFRAVLETLFSGASFHGIISFFALLKPLIEYSGETNLFSATFSKRLTYKANISRQLAKLAQEFTDLEYGVVGISNFYSQTNPAVRAESEVPIQEVLDQAEGKISTLLEVASSYFLAKAGGLIFDSKFLANFTLPTVYSFLSISKDLSVSNFVLKTSNRTSALNQQLHQLEEQMEKRQSELLKTRQLLKAKIFEIENQIEITTQREGYSK